MTFSSVLLLGAYLVVIVGLGYPLGLYMARLYDGTSPVLGWLAPLERLLYRAAGVREDEDMRWPRYALAVLLFNVLGALVVYGLERAQGSLPLNPAGLGAVSPEVSFNTAVSFASNTNWQSYGGETTLSYLTQMVGLTVQNFVSAATGMAVLVALIRGFSRKNAHGIGSFWVDLVRSVLYVLLPLAFVLALLLVSQGVVQTLGPYTSASLLDATTSADGASITDQLLARGPAASQIAIKQLGTNGGGFFNVNSAHPLRTRLRLSNFLECARILLIPAALCFTFGELMKDRRQGWPSRRDAARSSCRSRS
jgi:K+-transporting ATPase ATPase A chain